MFLKPTMLEQGVLVDQRQKQKRLGAVRGITLRAGQIRCRKYFSRWGRPMGPKSSSWDLLVGASDHGVLLQLATKWASHSGMAETRRYQNEFA
jgi:hypothetical protein